MATAKYAKLQMETGQTFFDYTEATDSGDQTNYTVSGKSIFSNKSGFEVTVRPDGIVTGTNVLSTHATDDTVTIAAMTCYLAGVLTTVAATTDTITRPATNVSKVNSITIDSTGSIAVVAGTDGATTAFSETRGAAGGPPYIPVGDIEVGQIRVTTSAAGVIASAEIFQETGTHTERYDSPTWTVSKVGKGSSAAVTAQTNAHIEFASTIGGAIHTGDEYRSVYISGYTPTMADISKAVDFVPAQNSHTLSSTQVYNQTIGSSSSSLGQASFTALLDDGITDTIITLEDETLTFKFYPNRNNAPYSITQGVLGLGTTYPVDDQIQVAATISAEEKTANFSA